MIALSPINDPLTSGKLHHAMVEVTSDCNLRCVYCAVSSPQWKGKTLPADKYAPLVESLKKLNTKVVILHGHGETTFVEGWHELAKMFLACGFSLVTCSNLNKNYSEEEIKVLGQFIGITVSLDTVDPVLFKQLRKGGTLQQLVYNMTRIKAAQTKPIRWVWSCVFCDQTYKGMLDVVKYGHAMGVTTFCMCNLTTWPHSPVKHVTELSQPEAKDALDVLNSINDYCSKHNLVADIKAGLIDTLKETVNATRGSTRQPLYTLMP